MSRHPFGWDLPPGVTQRMIDEQCGGDEGPCECCGNDPADCVCPECPVCGSQGDPKCYKDTSEFGPHHLQYSREQRMGQARMRIAILKEQIQDEELFLAYMESHPEEDPT
jgi:hypothetical protein